MRQVIGSLIVVALVALPYVAAQKDWYREPTEDELVQCRDAIELVQEQNPVPGQLKELMERIRSKYDTRPKKRWPLDRIYADLFELNMSASAKRKLEEAGRSFDEQARKASWALKCDQYALMRIEDEVLNGVEITDYLRYHPDVYDFIGYRRLAYHVVEHFNLLSANKHVKQAQWYRDPTQEELVKCRDAIERVAALKENTVPDELRRVVERMREMHERFRNVPVAQVYIYLFELGWTGDKDDKITQAGMYFNEVAGKAIKGLKECGTWTLMRIERDVLDRNQVKDYLRGHQALYDFIGYRRQAYHIVARYELLPSVALAGS